MENETRLLPEKTNEELLAELASMERGTVRIFKSFITGLVTAPIAGAMLATTQSTATALGVAGLTALSAIPGALWYRRREHRLEDVFAALKQRTETRAVPLLLRMQYYRLGTKPPQGYRATRTRQTIATLLPHMSPDDFQALDARYLGSVIVLAYDANPDLRLPTLDALARIGDMRALRMLTNPVYRPIRAVNAEVRDEIAACFEVMTARLEEEQRLAMLLRPSTVTEIPAAPETLLRAASPTASSTPAEELVRATSIPAHNVDAERNEYLQAHNTTTVRSELTDAEQITHFIALR